MTDKQQLTLMLKKWQAGDQNALDQLIPQVYQELRRLAKIQLNQGKNSIQCTELISEAYLKLVDITAMDWQDRTHFYSMAARTMRRVLVDRYRKRNTNKRGNDLTLHTLVEEDTQQSNAVELDALEDALLKLEQFDPELAEIVTLKFYGGLSHQEIASVVDSSERTIRRDWSVARLWLNRELSS
ncbi:ECF-type sigma factor [Marinicella litoralis]|uniref:RNA polymerase sigma factor (TIGR02999 family) n=1 Tax=Marinicella litoralis TaxID=644220 RepID=A0A4R6XT02_9GAMM|nr:ECF-type sigma factor [Marinicella litoralis]TDR20553.1 RNA polymerase sigma factor (TIGR02999 family) [Marinicella litoralis]